MAQSTSWGQEELLRVKIKEQHFGVMLRIGASRRAFTVDYQASQFTKEVKSSNIRLLCS